MSINWTNEWLTQYESPWSVLEKIKFANLISTKQLLQQYGTDTSNKIRYGKVGKRHRNLITLEGLDLNIDAHN